MTVARMHVLPLALTLVAEGCSARDVTRVYTSVSDSQASSNDPPGAMTPGVNANDSDSQVASNDPSGAMTPGASGGGGYRPDVESDASQSVADEYFDAVAVSNFELETVVPGDESRSIPCSGCLLSAVCNELLDSCSYTRPCVETNCLCAACLGNARSELPGDGASGCVNLCLPLDAVDCPRAWVEFMDCKVRQCAVQCGL